MECLNWVNCQVYTDAAKTDPKTTTGKVEFSQAIHKWRVSGGIGPLSQEIINWLKDNAPSAIYNLAKENPNSDFVKELLMRKYDNQAYIENDHYLTQEQMKYINQNSAKFGIEYPVQENSSDKNINGKCYFYPRPIEPQYTTWLLNNGALPTPQEAFVNLFESFKRNIGNCFQGITYDADTQLVTINPNDFDRYGSIVEMFGIKPDEKDAEVRAKVTKLLNTVGYKTNSDGTYSLYVEDMYNLMSKYQAQNPSWGANMHYLTMEQCEYLFNPDRIRTNLPKLVQSEPVEKNEVGGDSNDLSTENTATTLSINYNKSYNTNVLVDFEDIELEGIDINDPQAVYDAWVDACLAKVSDNTIEPINNYSQSLYCRTDLALSFQNIFPASCYIDTDKYIHTQFLGSGSAEILTLINFVAGVKSTCGCNIRVEGTLTDNDPDCVKLKNLFDKIKNYSGNHQEPMDSMVVISYLLGKNPEGRNYFEEYYNYDQENIKLSAERYAYGKKDGVVADVWRDDTYKKNIEELVIKETNADIETISYLDRLYETPEYSETQHALSKRQEISLFVEKNTVEFTNDYFGVKTSDFANEEEKQAFFKQMHDFILEKLLKHDEYKDYITGVIYDGSCTIITTIFDNENNRIVVAHPMSYGSNRIESQQIWTDDKQLIDDGFFFPNRSCLDTPQAFIKPKVLPNTPPPKGAPAVEGKTFLKTPWEGILVTTDDDVYIWNSQKERYVQVFEGHGLGSNVSSTLLRGEMIDLERAAQEDLKSLLCLTQGYQRTNVSNIVYKPDPSDPTNTEKGTYYMIVDYKESKSSRWDYYGLGAGLFLTKLDFADGAIEQTAAIDKPPVIKNPFENINKNPMAWQMKQTSTLGVYTNEHYKYYWDPYSEQFFSTSNETSEKNKVRIKELQCAYEGGFNFTVVEHKYYKDGVYYEYNTTTGKMKAIETPSTNNAPKYVNLLDDDKVEDDNKTATGSGKPVQQSTPPPPPPPIDEPSGTTATSGALNGLIEDVDDEDYGDELDDDLEVDDIDGNITDEYLSALEKLEEVCTTYCDTLIAALEDAYKTGKNYAGIFDFSDYNYSEEGAALLDNALNTVYSLLNDYLDESAEPSLDGFKTTLSAKLDIIISTALKDELYDNPDESEEMPEVVYSSNTVFTTMKRAAQRNGLTSTGKKGVYMKNGKRYIWDPQTGQFRRYNKTTGAKFIRALTQAYQYGYNFTEEYPWICEKDGVYYVFDEKKGVFYAK